MKKEKINKNSKNIRDLNILLSIKKEINMKQKCTTPNKKVYNRKNKFEY